VLFRSDSDKILL